MAMNPKRRLFVAEYLVDLNGAAAAARAGYSAKTAKAIAFELLADLEVQAAIQTAMDERAKRTEINADKVLQAWWDIHNADVNELVQYRRGACVDCYKVAEGDEALAALEDHRHNRDPNPDCLSCGGEGDGRTFVADTRKLTGSARRLYAGVRTTKDGIEVKMRDQDAALANAAKHLGMFKDIHEHSGPNGGPIPTVTRIELVGPEG